MISPNHRQPNTRQTLWSNAVMDTPRPPIPELARHRPAELLTPDETSELLRVPVQLLYRWRYERRGPPSFKIGRYVRYRRTDLQTWIDRQVSSSGTAG
jgi:predicted DNA-binding transcriptional regulator AlpA